MSGPMPLDPDGSQGETLALRMVKAPLRKALRWDETMTLRRPRFEIDHAAVDELAAELADRIGPAVHPYEVAALLESEGLTGELIKERYGHRNLFSLAAALYEKVPRTFPEPESPPDPWRPDHVRSALRGALFALPGLAYVLTSPLWDADRALAVLVVAGLVSWAWGQALGHRAFARMVAGRREAAVTLLKGAPLGATAATGAGILLSGSGAAMVAAAAQSMYLAAAGVLLVLGRERLLLASLAPLVAGAAVLPWWEPGDVLRAGLPLLALVGTVGAAAVVLRTALDGTAPAADTVRPPLGRSLPYGLFGLAAGTLVLLLGREEPWAVIVLTVSMGLAEWLLYRFRGLSVAALRASATPAGFRLRSAGVLALCLGCYLLPLLPLALLTGSPPVPLLLLAAALWIALLLQAFGVAWPPAVLSLAAAAVAGALTLADPPIALDALSVCTGAATLGLLGWALRLLGRPAPHA
ncbi:hypothetical protein AB0O01_35910 [Streptomyces sp. NPDC093252]|uniref:hypothetical protein n=1 Tax=Streptomyces sp. NPDC093252 TaxID=3154980 RepID=UPI0034206217